MLLKYKKIISFLPSATEILFELGFNDIVKGVTHACTYPTEAMSKPKIVKCSIDIDKLNSIEIDEKIKELYSYNKKLFVLDTVRIKEVDRGGEEIAMPGEHVFVFFGFEFGLTQGVWIVSN